MNDTTDMENIDRIAELDDLLKLINFYDNYHIKLFINEFSSFLCAYDTSYNYNQSFLPTMNESFLFYLKRANECVKILDQILLLLNSINEKEHYLKNNEEKKSFTVAVNGYIESNLFDNHKKILNDSCVNILNNISKTTITLKFSGELKTFYCFKADDSLDFNEIENNFKNLILNYNYFLFKPKKN
jgi:hypothetical protein